MDREITVTLTPSIIKWTLFYQLRSSIIIFCSVFLVLLAKMIFSIPRGSFPSRESLENLWIFILPILFARFFYVLYSKNMALLQKMKTHTVKYRITDDWLYIQTDLGSSQSSWISFKGLQKYTKLWSIVTEAGTTYVFPIELLDEELKTFLSIKLPKINRSRIVNFKSVAFWVLIFIIFFYFFKSGGH